MAVRRWSRVSLFGKFRRLLAQEGSGAALTRALNYVTPNWLFYALCGQIVRNDVAALEPYLGADIVRQATQEDLRALRRFDGYCDDLAGWIARGDRFVVAVRDGQVVGFENYQAKLHWLGPDNYIGVRLDEDELWAVFSLVDPAYRRRGIVTDIMRFAAQQMREDGYRFVYGHIADGDMPAKAAHGKRGFVAIDGWRIFRFLGTTYFTSNFSRRKGRWNGARPLKVRIREVSPGPGEQRSAGGASSLKVDDQAVISGLDTVG